MCAFLLLIGAGCTSAPVDLHREIRVVGSDTMLELDRRLAEAYMRQHPGDSVRVQGGGSGVGIEALIHGRAEIAAASRPLSAEEVAALYDRRGTLGVRFLVAQDALSVYLNAANPVRDLSLDQLRGLFTGSIKDWSMVAGSASAVVLVVRPPTSGTHRFFRDHVLGGAPYSSDAVAVPTTSTVLETVGKNPDAIGYGGIAYRGDGVVHAAVDGVAPTAENVRRSRYPLSRFLAFYTTKPPVGLARRFIDWCLGPNGQRVVAEVGYVPLWIRSQ
jgi:phosphate transport system substrate-binding protein